MTRWVFLYANGEPDEWGRRWIDAAVASIHEVPEVSSGGRYGRSLT